jgi:hypothetical protein
MSSLWLIDPTKLESYPAPVASLIRACPGYELGPGRPNLSVQSQLAKLTEQDILAHQPGCPEAARACLAGLWLLHGFLEQSHSISQSLSTREGSYWHGIMHRREPDYENAKYWFRRVGNHPVLERLAQEVLRLQEEPLLRERLGEQAVAPGRASSQVRDTVARIVPRGQFDPFAFVDLCREVARANAPAVLRALCQHVAWLEWQLLFDYCMKLSRHEAG